MGIFRKIKNYFRSKKVNKSLPKYKYVHLMCNNKFNKPFVDFLNKNFDANEHVVLCKKYFKEYPFPEGENVIKIKSLEFLNFENNEKIICHSLFDEDIINYLYSNQDILKEKAYWIIWGGDLYNAKRDKKNDFVRQNFKGYLGIMDKEYASTKYNLSAPFYNVHYPFPTTDFLANNFAEEKNKNTAIRIQINNSCDKSTLEVLDFLKKFKDENIVIVTILSYGDMQYKDEIIKKGSEYFGNKFEYLEKYLSSNDYKNFVCNNDILILNQNRQQGMGNLVAYIQQGKKVFVRNDVSSYKYLNNVENVKIFDTLCIESMSFEEFIKNDYVEQNRLNIKNWTKEECLVGLWRTFFNAK